MSGRTIKGKTAIVGVGESQYYKHGQSPVPEFRLCLDAILAACDDAGLDPREIDGFASFADDRNDPTRLMAALGLRELRHSSMMFGGGGGGGCGAVGHAAAALATGLADVVVVFRALTQGAHGRFGRLSWASTTVEGPAAFGTPYGLIAPAHRWAMRTRRFMHEHSIRQEALRAIALASYFHAQQNPRALMYGKPLSEDEYDRSRWIVEPFHLYDCCMESDGAAAVILTSSERAADLRQRPAYVWATAQGGDHRQSPATIFNDTDLGSANFKSVARRLWEAADVEPDDVDVVQSYEHFTGGVVMALCEHGLFEPEQANEFLTFENLAGPNARLPLNTSGGNLAECYVHGLQLVLEAVRQVRGTSTCQVPDVQLSLVHSGASFPTSNLLLAASSA